MDALRGVVLDAIQKKDNVKPGRQSLIAHRTVLLYLQDRDGEVYKLDIVRGLGLEKLRKKAEKLSGFCGIPFEDKLQAPSELPGEDDQ